MLDNGQRALAHIEKIASLSPIEGADRIEVAQVLGWKVVVKKGEFQVGDKVVYIEIDSKVPASNPYFAFLQDRKYKVKTIKLRGQISQGLVVPVDVLPYGVYKIGDNVTEILGITKIEDRFRPRNERTSEEMRLRQSHPKLVRAKWFKKLMRYKWFRKFAFKYLISKRKSKFKDFPTGYEGVSKTDEERCLVGGTKILTDKGPIQISAIVNQRLDVKVLSMNDDGTVSYKKILDYQKFNNKDEVMTIGYAYSVDCQKQNHLVCTPDHRIYTQRGYIPARDLTLEDEVFLVDTVFNQEALGAIYGTLLGDGYISNDKRSQGKLRVAVTHGEKQLDYLLYKKSMFDNIGKILQGKSGYCNNKIYRWSLPVDGYFSKMIRTDFYQTGKKRITKEALNKLNDVGLAFWYMDDGNLSHRDGKSQSPSIRMNTQGFSYEENELLSEYLTSLGIENHVREDRKNGKIYYIIYINVKGTPIFLERITPYMCKSMAYKTLPSLEPLLETKTCSFKQEQRVISTPVTSIEYGQHKNKTWSKSFKVVYDLEVEDNHNFFADGIVTHNCENMPWILQDKSPFVVTTKIDGTSCTVLVDHTKRKEEVYVCSRNVRQARDSVNYHDNTGDDNVYWQAVDKYKLLDFLREAMFDYDVDWACIQGEIAGISEGGAKIQGDPHKFGELRFFGFNLILPEYGRIESVEAAQYAEACGIPWVPIIDTNYILPDTMEEFKEAAVGPCEAAGAHGQREGYVYRKVGEPTFSFKNINNKYLLKNDSY